MAEQLIESNEMHTLSEAATERILKAAGGIIAPTVQPERSE